MIQLNVTFLTGMQGGFNDTAQGKYWEKCPTQNKNSTNIHYWVFINSDHLISSVRIFFLYKIGAPKVKWCSQKVIGLKWESRPLLLKRQRLAPVGYLEKAQGSSRPGVA